MSDDPFTTDGELHSRGTWTLFAGVVIACLLVMLGLVAMMRAGIASDDLRPPAASEPGTSRWAQPSEFMIDALLLPALQPDTLPLRWREPRVAMGCGPGSEMSVDREPLRPGSPVPLVPFVVDWDARGCYPLGADGPRFDGRARLTVYREDWGFSAMMEPAGMRITTRDGRILHLRRGGASRSVDCASTRSSVASASPAGTCPPPRETRSQPGSSH